MSVVLFFLDLPGPADREFDFKDGLTGDDSLDGAGELVAEAARLDWKDEFGLVLFVFVLVFEVVDESRTSFGVDDVGCSL